jgi:sigma-B regulation protein RsbU (phosphoserine phosphatase)
VTGVPDESALDLYEHAPCGYLSTDPDGLIVRVNRTFLDWTGYADDALVGVRRFPDLLTAGGRIYHETHFAPLLRMQGAVREIAVEIRCADGSWLPALVNAVLVRDDAGEPQLVRTTIFDATDRQRYEHELRLARDRERAARERVEQLQRASVARYEEQRDAAHILQRALLAGAPPADPRFDVAAHYAPAGEDLEVGGDWHDTFALPDGRIAVVVGDVVGRGLVAASAMGQLRSAVRALAAARRAPAQLLADLDAFVEQVPTAQYATLVYAEVDPDTGATCFASAGHLPALLLRAGAPPQLFMDGRSGPLGTAIPGVERVQAAHELGPRDGFVLYTDGLVERRTESIDDGLDRLIAAVGARTAGRPAKLVEHLARALLPADHGDDDVCLLCFTRRAG